MRYVLAPTNNDLVHYAKGKESKNHKYISRVFKNGKWHYFYTPSGKSASKKTTETVPKNILGMNIRGNLYKSGGGSHSFGYSPAEKAGKNILNVAVEKHKELKAAKAAKELARKRADAEKARKAAERDGAPQTILGANTRGNLYKSGGASHEFGEEKKSKKGKKRNKK